MFVAIGFSLVTLMLAGTGFIPWPNALGLLGLLAGVYAYRHTQHRWLGAGLWLLLVPLVLWVATYRPAQFSYPLVMTLEGEKPFFLYVNIAKAMAGYCLLLLLWPSEQRVWLSPKEQMGYLFLAPLFVIVVAVPALNLQWQIKMPLQILQFALVNLLVTCVAEEAFMRLLLQQPMMDALRRFSRNQWLVELLPLLVCSLLFMAIHPVLSGAALCVYALAGLVYGLAYSLSKHIGLAIGVHFLVNLFHFAYLTYPL